MELLKSSPDEYGKGKRKWEKLNWLIAKYELSKSKWTRKRLRRKISKLKLKIVLKEKDFKLFLAICDVSPTRATVRKIARKRAHNLCINQMSNAREAATIYSYYRCAIKHHLNECIPHLEAKLEALIIKESESAKLTKDDKKHLLEMIPNNSEIRDQIMNLEVA